MGGDAAVRVELLRMLARVVVGSSPTRGALSR